MESKPEVYVTPLQPAESYNGARHENFTWSQSINDLDVIIGIPDCLKNQRDLRLDFTSTEIKVEARKSVLLKNRQQQGFVTRESFEEWTIIFQGQFSFPIKKNESIWSLTSGEHVDIHLEKCREKWWQALLIDEEKIDLSRIDCSRYLNELGEVEQMKVRELMWNERTKILRQ